MLHFNLTNSYPPMSIKTSFYRKTSFLSKNSSNKSLKLSNIINLYSSFIDPTQQQEKTAIK